MCDLEVIGDPSIFKTIRSSSLGEDVADPGLIVYYESIKRELKIRPICVLDLSCEEKVVRINLFNICLFIMNR